MELHQWKEGAIVVPKLEEVLAHEGVNIADFYEGPGRIYPGGLVIEGVPGDYILTIGAYQNRGPDLEDMERELHQWATDEGYWS
jgi:hypothetical protein